MWLCSSTIALVVIVLVAAVAAVRAPALAGAPNLVLVLNDNGPWTISETGDAYTFVVQNTGSADTAGTITVTDTLPGNLTVNSTPTGAGWTCTANGTSIACTSATVIPAGASSAPITLAVTVGAGTPIGSGAISNIAYTYGGGDPVHVDAATAQQSDNDQTAIYDIPLFTNTTSNNNVIPGTTFADTFVLTNTTNYPYQFSVFNLPAAPTITWAGGAITPSSYTLNGNPEATLAALNQDLTNYSEATGGAVTVGVLYTVPAGATSGQTITDRLGAIMTPDEYPGIIFAHARRGVEAIQTTPTISATAIDTVVAVSPLTTTETFSPASVSAYSPSTLTVTIANTGPVAIALTGLSMSPDALPAGVTLALTPAAATTCGAGVVSAPPGGASFSLSGGTLAAGATCTVSVNVTSASVGTYTNTIPATSFTTNEGPTSSGAAMATLTVTAAAALSITTSNSSVIPGTTFTDYFYLLNSSGQNGSWNLPSAPTLTWAGGTITPSGYANGDSLFATLDSLNANLLNASTPVGATLVIGVQYTVPATATPGQTINDTLVATEIGPDTIIVGRTRRRTIASRTVSDPASATAIDTIVGPILALTKTDNGPWTIGQSGAAYTITPANTGVAATSGTITVTDTLPGNLTANGNPTGTGWTCTGSGTATIACTSSTGIAAGTSGNPITVAVNIGAGTPMGTNAISNIASIYGGGDPAHATAGTAATSPADRTSINLVPTLIVTTVTTTSTSSVVTPGTTATDVFLLKNTSSQTGTFNLPVVPTIIDPGSATAGASRALKPSGAATASTIAPSGYTLNGTSYATLSLLNTALAALPVASGASASIGVLFPVPASATAGEVFSDQLSATVTSVSNATSAIAASTAYDTVIAPVLSGIKSVKLTTDANGNGVPSAGDTLTYTIGYANNGAVTITNAQITDALPAGTSLVAGSVAIVSASGVTPAPAANAAYDGVANQNLLASGVSMSVGATLVVSFRVTMGSGTAPITNRAMLSGTGLSSSVQTSAVDNATTGLPGLGVPAGSINQGANGAPNAGPPLNAATTVIPATISTIGVKSVQNLTHPGTSVAAAGDTIAYTITYVNTGTAPIAGVNISDALPAGVSLVGSPRIATSRTANALPSANTSYNGLSSTSLFASPVLLSVGASVTVTIDATIVASTSETLLNRATLSGIGLPATGVASSAADSSTTALPAGVTIPGGSVNQGPNATPNTGPPPAAATALKVTAVTRALIVTKTVDRAVVSGGDPLIYTITVTNPNTFAVTALDVIDTLPGGMAYARGSTRIDNLPSPDPVISGRTLTWTIASAAAGAQHTVIFATTVAPGAAVGSTLINTATANAKAASGGTITGPNAQAASTVVGGIFTSCVTIVGRVFVDSADTGRYAPGDAGIGGVRIYLESGASVITDRAGKFNFACINPGMHVLRLDTSTLPAAMHAYDVHDNDNPRSIVRLVHGTLDAGMIDNINFAIFGDPPAGGRK
jgi:uncharacterized repeat protein (TIGR01451 family)